MTEKGKYVLFLRSNKINDSYVILGLHQGKYDLNQTKQAKQNEEGSEGIKKAFSDPAVEYLGHGQEFEHFYKLKDEVVKKYKD